MSIQKTYGWTSILPFLEKDTTLVQKRARLQQEVRRNAAISAMKELLKGPNSTFYFSVIPPGTSLSVEIYENFIRVDLKPGISFKQLRQPGLDELIIYSMVNTLTQIPGIDGVLFLIEGKSIKEYGNIDLSLPLIKNEEYFFES
jgi:spore germination protein GerM